MINPKFEIERLRNTLKWKGLDDREAAEVSNLAAADIAEAISELTLNAMAEAIQIGDQLGIQDFSDQIRAVNTGNTVAILTDSGQTNFSWPAIEMLPHLLKNAKVSKDGTRYKVIPIKPKVSVGMSSADAAIDIQRAQVIAKDALKNKGAPTQGDPLQSSNLFSGLAQAKDFIANKKKIKEQHDKSVGGNPTYRTATDKQNPSTQWVIPAKDRDVTMLLNDINRQLEMNIQSTVVDIVRQYEDLV